MESVFKGVWKWDLKNHSLQFKATLPQSRKKKSDKNLAEGKKFLEENKKPGVIELPDGMQHMVMKTGTGPKPVESDTVIAHYHGTLLDGTVFESSVQRGEQLPILWISSLKDGLKHCWWWMWVQNGNSFIPADLAYGEHGSQQIGP